ncbi:MAG: Uma2 family endonuclease [Pyrinomonadaceae bacterium]
MGVPKLKPKISVEDYLEGEKVGEIRHEYIGGEVFAMSGVSKNHNRINRRLLESIQSKLKSSDCETFFVDVKVRVEKLNRFYYPDLVLVCEEDTESEYFISKPTVIVEISSPSTAATDRREKLFAYQEIASLQEYLMIDQESEYAELYRRRDDGLWSWIEFEADEELELESVNFKMPMSELYR